MKFKHTKLRSLTNIVLQTWSLDVFEISSYMFQETQFKKKANHFTNLKPASIPMNVFQCY